MVRNFKHSVPAPYPFSALFVAHCAHNRIQAFDSVLCLPFDCFVGVSEAHAAPEAHAVHAVLIEDRAALKWFCASVRCRGKWRPIPEPEACGRFQRKRASSLKEAGTNLLVR